MKLIDDIIQTLKADLVGVNVHEGWAQGEFPYVCVTFGESFGPSAFRGFVDIDVDIYCEGPDTVQASNIRNQVLQSIGNRATMSDDMGFYRVRYRGYSTIGEEEDTVHYSMILQARVIRAELPLNYT